MGDQYVTFMRTHGRRPECFADSEYYDSEHEECASKCPYRRECRSQVLRGGKSVKKTPSSRLALVKGKKETAPTTALAHTSVKLDNFEIAEGEHWSERLASECAASAISAVGFTVGGFFSPGNFRFPFMPKKACPGCGTNLSKNAAFCGDCGFSFAAIPVHEEES